MIDEGKGRMEEKGKGRMKGEKQSNGEDKGGKGV